ncbi:helix-turn-helix transcriptional regulator [Cellulophaga baltica]|uniref:helix-turn-helix domain-containing protein n=1 Tax=Cellulophaga baltica TaxID=76594 RepID=UPI0021487BDF|nr:helix-turn-helix transcriptional regulator [Cellulophaga baltica]MCR1024479.1 helix-turn-helix transcriptional regulator [Cellulophaga baltica]
MDSIADNIVKLRKQKGWSQEELAEQAKISLRTLQRIESKTHKPRGKIVSLIGIALECDFHEIASQQQKKAQSFSVKFINYFFLIIANLILVAIAGFTTIDADANLNSKIAGVLLSIFIPLCIVQLTLKMPPTERLLKFGLGYFIYFVSVFSIAGFVTGFTSGLFVCLLISLTLLYFGQQVLNKKTRYFNEYN